MTPFFLLLSEINVELTECFDMNFMLRPVCIHCTAAIVFLHVSTLYSLLEENISLFLSAGATFPDIPGTGEAFQVFCDRRATAGFSFSNTTLES